MRKQNGNELKGRVEQNENAWMKVQTQLNQLESRLLNQMAEYGKEIIRIQEQVTNIRSKVDALSRR